ncbi:Lon protease family protein [Simiduia aestuariiviva]|uniref:endopeptidase La n=1 Tax=Simiduia aestuariiviva TaxID=1510459 RepID=A0A839UT92_9GAMM|nr:ATP-binding protein [Simiduia aestuariiviva]MBB3168728.1 lon-related putative ATP-dependent protease [Simiduia aestuariiviva]
MPSAKQICTLSSAQLSVAVDPAQCAAQPQADAPVDLRVIGHERARAALEFGLSMAIPGFNIFAVGDTGTGRRTLISQALSAHAASLPAGAEWCYINNFDNPHAPQALWLNPGDGKALLSRINRFIDELLVLFPEVFENPAYQRKKKQIDRKFSQRYEEAIAAVEQEALANSVGLYEEDGSVTFAPLIDGQAVDDAQFAALSESDRNHFYQLLASLEERLSERLLELPVWKREAVGQLRKLKYDTIEQVVRPLLKDLGREYASHLGVQKYLREVKEHIADTLLDIIANEDEENPDDRIFRHQLERKFLPNLLEARDPTQGAPVVFEQNPTFQNLFGVVDYNMAQGVLKTNYRMIRAGAFHRANGGFLLLDAEKLLNQPAVWQQFKLVLKTQQIQIEPPYGELGSTGAYQLQPEKIPLAVKVVLLGSPEVYYTLQQLDEEFAELFRVLADFDRHLLPTDDNLFAFSALVRERGRRLAYPSISDEAVALLARMAMRNAEHQRKLSANIQQWNELLDEAHYIWRTAGSEGDITASHVAKAREQKQYRTGRISEAMLEDIKERQVLISTEGRAVGAINGLTVYSVGDNSFGNPARITATVYAGKQGVTDIEREAELGRAIHSKGVMLLTGYLGHTYGQHFQLSISANIAIEQSYGQVDGDSASLAEVCALISAVTGIPIDQSLAVTGSINQHGQVQSIGGANEKIEGFFRLCRDRGLTGQQGVIIPKTNQMNLMLDDDVLAAVAAGQFAVYAVETIDQALELLLDTEAGEPDGNGGYPPASVHGKAMARLKALSALAHAN